MMDLTTSSASLNKLQTNNPESINTPKTIQPACYDRSASSAVHVKSMRLAHKDFSLQIRDLTIEKNCCTVIVGSNGSGKTRFLESLLGLTQATTQMTLLDQTRSVAASPIHVRRQVGIQMLDEGYPRRLRVRDLVKAHKLLYKASDESIAEIFRINEISWRHISDLSCGERQRFKLYMAWSHRPQLVIMDEPFTGLDQSYRSALKTLLQKRVDQTVIMTCHSADEIIMADNLIWINEGHVLKQDNPRNLMVDLLGSYRVAIQCEDETARSRIKDRLQSSDSLRYLGSPWRDDNIVAYGTEKLEKKAREIVAGEKISGYALSPLSTSDLIKFCASGGHYV